MRTTWFEQKTIIGTVFEQNGSGFVLSIDGYVCRVVSDYYSHGV